MRRGAIVEVPLTWKFTIQGAEDIKTKLSEINSAFERGEISTSEYAKGLREVNRDARSFTNIGNIQKNLILAQHPAINALSRATSTFASVARGLTAISHIFNLAMIANNTTSSQRLEILKGVNESQRRVNKLIAEGKEGTVEYSIALEDAAIEAAKLKEFNDTEFAQSWSNLISIIAGMSTAIATAMTALKANPRLTAVVTGAAIRLGALFAAAFVATSTSLIQAGTWLFNVLHGPQMKAKILLAGARGGGLFGVAFTGAAIAVIGAGVADYLAELITGRSLLRDLGLPSVADVVKETTGIETIPGRSGSNVSEVANAVRMKKMADDILNFFKPVTDLFTNLIPQAHAETAQSFQNTFTGTIPQVLAESIPLLKEQTIAMWNVIIDVTNIAGQTLTEGINRVFSQMFAHLNRLISKYNRAARKIGKPTVAHVGFTPATFTAIPLIQAATGFEGLVNKPTMFLAGESGPEAISITPRSRSLGAGSGTVIIINVQGSILTEREFIRKVDQSFKESLKRRGFTGV